MDEEVRSSDCSWKKIVIAKTNNQWSSIKAKRLPDEVKTMNTSNFSLSDDQMTFVEVKIEHEGETYPSVSYEEQISDATSTSSMDPLLENETREAKRRRRKGSGSRPETLEERAMRLSKMSAYAAQRLANESPEQRAIRLKRMSDYAAKRLAQETSDQRAKRLARMSAYAAKRLADESPEQRQARLARMSAYAAKRQALRKYMEINKMDEMKTNSSQS